jgi:hypothetical protein
VSSREKIFLISITFPFRFSDYPCLLSTIEKPSIIEELIAALTSIDPWLRGSEVLGWSIDGYI